MATEPSDHRCRSRSGSESLSAPLPSLVLAPADIAGRWPLPGTSACPLRVLRASVPAQGCAPLFRSWALVRQWKITRVYPAEFDEKQQAEGLLLCPNLHIQTQEVWRLVWTSQCRSSKADSAPEGSASKARRFLLVIPEEPLSLGLYGLCVYGMRGHRC